MSGEPDVKRICFFIPVYFDVESFFQLRKNILTLLRPPLVPHFYLLDDTSDQDPYLKQVQVLSDVTMIKMPHNLGHQRAIVYGLRDFLSKNVSDCLIVTMDGDGEDRPEDLSTMILAYQSQAAQMPLVLAKRTQRKETYFFKFFYFLYKNIFRVLTGTIIQTGNFALMHSQVAKRNVFHPFFDLAYSSSLLALGNYTVFVPCPRGNRYFGKSKMNFAKLANHGVCMLMPFMDRVAVRGVIFFAILNILSFVSSAALILIKVSGSFPVSNWAVFSSLLFFAFTFSSIFSLGILMTVFVNIQGVAMSRLMKSNS